MSQVGNKEQAPFQEQMQKQSPEGPRLPGALDWRIHDRNGDRQPRLYATVPGSIVMLGLCQARTDGTWESTGWIDPTPQDGTATLDECRLDHPTLLSAIKWAEGFSERVIQDSEGVLGRPLYMPCCERAAMLAKEIHGLHIESNGGGEVESIRALLRLREIWEEIEPDVNLCFRVSRERLRLEAVERARQPLDTPT